MLVLQQQTWRSERSRFQESSVRDAPILSVESKYVYANLDKIELSVVYV
jgi:hypothetical protein